MTVNVPIEINDSPSPTVGMDGGSCPSGHTSLPVWKTVPVQALYAFLGGFSFSYLIGTYSSQNSLGPSPSCLSPPLQKNWGWGRCSVCNLAQSGYPQQFSLEDSCSPICLQSQLASTSRAFQPRRGLFPAGRPGLGLPRAEPKLIAVRCSHNQSVLASSVGHVWKNLYPCYLTLYLSFE